MRIRIRPRLPVFALLLLAPSIPELLTGSTPITHIVTDPVGFAVGFPLDIALYGSGALLIREFTVIYQKGWASILLLGAGYGIAEEGFEVHTFSAPPSYTVGALGVYGHWAGVNWLWALSLTIFHATYSIALPILLTHLWFPQVRDERWLDRGALSLLGAIYLAEVVGFGAFVAPYPLPAPALAFFLALVAVLVFLAYRVPRYLLAARTGPRRVGPMPLRLLGATSFTAYLCVLIFAAAAGVPAVGSAVVLLVADGGVVLLVLRWVGTEDLDRSKFYFACGMFYALFAWDILIEVIAVPGILAVSALFAYLLYRLGRTLDRRAGSGSPGGAPVGP